MPSLSRRLPHRHCCAGRKSSSCRSVWNPGQLRLPAELLAEYYAVNIVYLGKWWLQRPTEIPMPELKKYLRLLFANKDFLLPPGENGQTD